MDVTFEPAPRRDLKALPKEDASRIATALEQVAAEHPRRLSFVTEMQGRLGTWRLRKGDYRAVFRVTGRAIEVIAIGHGREIRE